MNSSGRVLRQSGAFLIISGIGWLMDFGIYLGLSAFAAFDVWIANILGAIPAVTFVFVCSTRKIFAARNNRFSLRAKYCAYLIYQGILLFAVSLLAQYLYQQTSPFFSAQAWNLTLLKLLIKCFITSITMTCNFFFMKVLIEYV